MSLKKRSICVDTSALSLLEKCAELKDRDKEAYLKPAVLQCKVKKQTPATGHQVERLREIIDYYHIEDEIIWDTLTRSQASRLIDQYYADYGRPQKIR